MQKDYIKKVVLGLMFPVVFGVNVNASSSFRYHQDREIRKNPFFEKSVEKCDSLSFESFNTACQYGNFGKAEELIACGVDINARDERGETALMIASLAGRLNVVRFLIEHGADVNLTNYEGETALMLARKYSKFYVGRHAEVERLLIKSGASQKGLSTVKVMARPQAPWAVRH